MEAARIEPAQDFNRWRRLPARLLASHELDSLVPSHLSTLFEDRGRSGLAEPGTGSAEVALAPGLDDPRASRDAELFPCCVDSSLEAKSILVSSEAREGHGEPEHLKGLPDYVSVPDPELEVAGVVSRGTRVVPPVHGTVGEVMILLEFFGQRLRTLELPGCQEQLANTAGGRW